MPRSFMITHRRFGEDDLIGINKNNNSSNSNVERSSEICDDRMHPDSPVRSYVSYIPDSPETKKQKVFHCRGSDKSVSVSDGESDSGCSSQTDTRHELPLELEYSLGCSSGFSLLLELMTQSPQRYSSRDILDLNIFSEAKSSGQRLGKEDQQKGKVDLGQIKKIDTYQGTAVHIERIENSNMHIRFSPENEPCVKDVESVRYVHDVSEKRNGLSECAVYSNDGDFQTCINKDYSHGNATLGIQVSSQTTPVYDFQIYSNQEPKMNHIQRRISFDEDMVSGQKIKGFNQSESQDDQPIDYSQLSSRRREKSNERPHGRPHGIGQDSQEQKEKARKMSDEVYEPTKKPMTGPAAIQKYEFILSPKMDGNGNIVLSQPNKIINRSLQPGEGQDGAGKGDETLHSPAYGYAANENFSGAANYAQQSSPLSGSPASPQHCSPDSKHGTALDIAKAKFEPQKHHQESPGIGKAQLTYHPKLKYLLAVSQYSKAKDTQDEGPLPTTAASSFPSYQQTMLFSQDQTAQAEKFFKLNDNNENVHKRSEVGQDQHIPSSELFHTLNNSQNCSLNNASVFNLNHASTFKASSIDISKGSTVNDKQQISVDIHSPQISSSPSLQISNSFNGSRTPDQHQCDSGLDTPSGMYPTSPGQPLSPASLRDQQAALSELLFSGNRKSGIDPYACVDCAKRYSTSSNLARHRQTHRSVCDKKARKCPHCDKVYVSMPAYSMHVRTHNQGCECPHCGKKFSRPWLLQGHIRTHTGEKPFGCPQCGKSFADKSNLRAHIQTHSTEKPYVCGRCGKAFALKSYLYKHEESSCMRGQRFRH